MKLIDKFPKKIGILHYAGLGDWLLFNPVLRAIKRRSPDTKIYIVAEPRLKCFLDNDRFIDGYSLLPDQSVFKKNFGYDEDIVVFNLRDFLKITNCRQHVIDLACKIFNVDNDGAKPKIYLSRRDDDFGRAYAKLCKHRMITLCCDASEKIKEWGVRRWEGVVKKCNSYLFVQIGRNSRYLIKGAINLTRRTTLPQAMSLVKHSELFVGSDGFFNHVAGVFDTPRVILWGPANHNNFGDDNKIINIWKGTSCFCCYGAPTPECQAGINRGRLSRCMNAIPEFEVTSAVKKALGEDHDHKIKYYRLRHVLRDTCLRCQHRGLCNIDFFKKRFSDIAIFKVT